MLSEIELNGHPTLFLCDFDSASPEGRADDATAPESDAGSSEGEHQFPDSIVLYILWRPDMESSPKALAKGVIAKSVTKLKSLTEHNKDCQIYLVIDTLILSDSTRDGGKDEAVKLRRYQSQVALVEELARSISTDLRDDLQGLTVGVSNHVRAAPGLEKCMEAICWGSKDRRKNGGQGRSSIGIVTQHPDDLVGLQKDPDAAQNVLQSYTCAEWNGNGDILSFAKRTHARWCTKNEVMLEEEDSMRPKNKPRRNQNLDQLDGGALTDPMTLFVVLFLAIWLYIHITSSYEDGFQGYMNWLKSLAGRRESAGDSS
jgi:hypothetical protein